MMKHTAVLFASFTLCSCSTQVMRRAHVIPIFGDEVLLSARPQFLGPGTTPYDDARFTRPKIWSYEQLSDGSTLVYWISSRTAKEKLELLEIGFHSIEVPPEAIKLIANSNSKQENHAPTVLNILGTNSAFIREAVMLAPYKNKAGNSSRGHSPALKTEVKQAVP